MKSNGMLLGTLTLVVMSASIVAAAEPSGGLRAALKHAGGNRSELEIGMSKAKGKDTEFLITHASHYDLANLTSQQIIENVTYARKVHAALPCMGSVLTD